MLRLTSVLLFALVLATAHCEEKYTDKYDHIDVKAILENDELRNQYYKCFMDEGPCVTEDQTFVKAFLPEVIVTQCRKCTDKQKEAFDMIVTWYTEKKPEEWDLIVEKFVRDAQKLGVANR